jgi:glutamine synthetase
MREGDGGMDYIEDIIEQLAKHHALHIELYGDNMDRLSGKFETSKADRFTFGVGHRGASCRIPT